MSSLGSRSKPWRISPTTCPHHVTPRCRGPRFERQPKTLAVPGTRKVRLVPRTSTRSTIRTFAAGTLFVSALTQLRSLGEILPGPAARARVSTASFIPRSAAGRGGAGRASARRTCTSVFEPQLAHRRMMSARTGAALALWSPPPHGWRNMPMSNTRLEPVTRSTRRAALRCSSSRRDTFASRCSCHRPPLLPR